MRVTVLGGKGLLGRHLAALLSESGHEVVVSSRSASGPRELKADLITGEGLTEAVDGSDVVVHLVSDPRRHRATDFEGTRRLLDLLDGRHLIYVSIVGVDEHPFSYYRTKRDVERMIEQSGRPHTIVRATQFHDFVAFLLGMACRLPIASVPKRFVFQPVEVAEVAAHLAAAVDSRPSGLQPDIAGPEVHPADHLARTFMEARGRERPLVNFPVFGATARAFVEGVHTNPDRAVGKVTWDEYLSTSGIRPGY